MNNKLRFLAVSLKRVLFMGAAFVVVAVVVGVFAAGPVIAQAVRAALVSNVDEPGRIPFSSPTVCFANGDFCRSNFGFDFSVPQGKRLVITHVSGYVQTNQPGGTLLMVNLVTNSGATLFPTIFQGADQFGNGVYVINESVLNFSDAGSVPYVIVTARGATYLNASFRINGYLLDCSVGPCAAVAR